MERPAKSLDAAFFNEMYSKNEDPWDFENSPYEREKYEETLKAIPNDVYENVFEIGCSNGILTQKLASISRHLVAVDASDIAVANAKKRLAGDSHVEVGEMTIPGQFPNDLFDLILLSEVGYFLSKEDLIIARNKIIDALSPYGHLLLVHWTPVVAEFPLTGDEVHNAFMECTGELASQPLTWLSGKRNEKYRLDLFEKKTV